MRRNKLFARALRAEGIDLERDYFSLYDDELRIVERVRKAFNYAGNNYLGRSKTRQFYYSAQRAKN